jgi:hypothetical protein
MCSELPLVADRLPGHSVSINSAQNTDTLLVCKDFSGTEVAQSSSTKQFAPMSRATSIASCTTFKYVAQGCHTICCRDHGTLREGDQQMTTRSEFSRLSPQPASPLQPVWLHAESLGRCCRFDFHRHRSAAFPRTLKFNRSGEGGKLICPN